MKVGDKIFIDNTNEVWDNKVGVIEELDDTGEYALVRVDFGDNKLVRQEFSLDNLIPITKLKEGLTIMKDEELFKQVAFTLDIGDDELEYSNGVYIDTTTGYKYEIKTYGELKKAAIEYERNSLETIGFSTLFGSYHSKWFVDWVYRHAVDESFIEDLYRETVINLFIDLSPEDLADEAIVRKVIEEEDVYNEESELLASFDKETIADAIATQELESNDLLTCIDYLSDYYGDSFIKILERNNALNYDIIAEEIVSIDGIDNYLDIVAPFELDNNNYLVRVD